MVNRASRFIGGLSRTSSRAPWRCRCFAAAVAFTHPLAPSLEGGGMLLAFLPSGTAVSESPSLNYIKHETAEATRQATMAEV